MILWLYLSNFTSEHTAELGLGQGIRMLGWVGTKLSFVEIKAKFRINLPRCWYPHVYFLFLQQSACSIYLTLMVSVSYNGATVAYYRPRATIPAFSLIKKKSKAFSLRSVLVWFIRTYNEGYIIIYNIRIYPCRCVYVSLAVYF